MSGPWGELGLRGLLSNQHKNECILSVPDALMMTEGMHMRREDGFTIDPFLTRRATIRNDAYMKPLRFLVFIIEVVVYLDVLVDNFSRSSWCSSASFFFQASRSPSEAFSICQWY